MKFDHSRLKDISMRLWLAIAALIAFCVVAPPAAAQDTTETVIEGALLVYMDCNGPSCDFDHFRREITWVSWVRQREDADVHLLITTQRTGGGGRQYTLDYIGRHTFEGQGDTLTFTSDGIDTSAERREGLTRTIALGLVRYAAATSLAQQIRIDFEAPLAQVADQAEEEDPWNLWVFNMNANGSLRGESLQRFYSIGGSASANRTSEDFKITWRLNGRTSRDEFDFVDEEEGVDTTFVNTQKNWGTRLLMVWSLSDHWSIGGTASASHSTFGNVNLSIAAGPAIEYNIFPYSESTRKSFTFRYSVEVARFNYELITVGGRTKEVLPRHTVEVSVGVQQPWGSVFSGINVIQYLHDPKVHRLEFDVGFNIRVFRGFFFNVNGNIARIKDQFFLPAEGLSPAEVLLRRRARETDFQYGLRVGFRYQFGSQFANIVNPRF